MTQDIYAKLTPIFREVFEDEAIVPEAVMTAADVERWDSLSYVRLIVSIEECFGIRFSTPEITDLKNVDALVKLIEKKTAQVFP